MLILRKFYNAADLLWESLDAQERMILLYIVGSVVVSLLASAQRRSREALKDQIRAELVEEIRGGR